MTDTDDKLEKTLARFSERLDEIDRRAELLAGERERVRLLWLAAESKRHKALKAVGRSIKAAVQAGLIDLAQRGAVQLQEKAAMYKVDLPGRAVWRKADEETFYRDDAPLGADDVDGPAD